MIRRFDFDGIRMLKALKKTFAHRKTPLPKHKPLFAEEIYDEKSDRQTLWKTFLKKGDIKHTPEKLSIIAKEIEEFLIKPLAPKKFFGSIKTSFFRVSFLSLTFSLWFLPIIILFLADQKWRPILRSRKSFFLGFGQLSKKSFIFLPKLISVRIQPPAGVG